MKLIGLRKQIVKIAYIAFSIILILFGSSCSKETIQSSDSPDNVSDISEYSKTDDEFDRQIKNSNGLNLIVENNEMQLSVDGKTSEIAVKEKMTGYTWYTNPINRDSDVFALGGYKDELNSQFTLQYVDDSEKNYIISSFFDSVSNGQYNFYKIPDGIRITYVLGKIKKTYLVPFIMSIERFEEIISKLDEAEKTELTAFYNFVSIKGDMQESDKALQLQKYPILKDKDIYVLYSGFTSDTTTIPEFLLNNLEKYFIKAQYTLEDLNNDNKENQISQNEEKNYTVKLSIEYKLDGSDLIARVPKGAIQYDDKVMTVTKLSFLQYFGCAGKEKTGYMLIPDGSGALINLNNGKTNVNSYSKEIYGRDRSIVLNKTKQDDGTQIYLPVYGIKQDSNAFLAVIESGDPIAQINADVSDKISSYNYVYPSFTLKQKAEQPNSIVNISGNNVYQKETFQNDIQIRFMFMENEAADYTGMALRYQKYLLDKNKITKQDFKNNELNFNLGIIGAISYNTTFLGLPVKSQKALTSYSQTIEIIKMLKTNGINNISLNYFAWCNGGLDNSIFNKIELISSLGGSADFSLLNQYANSNSVGLFGDVNLLYVKQNSVWKGYNENTMSARDLANTIAYDYEYNLSTLEKNDKTKKAIVSPVNYESITNGLLNGIKKNQIKGIGLANMGNELNSDFKNEKIVDRQNAIKNLEISMSKISNAGYEISVSGGNAYSLKYASILNDIPISSGRNYLFDQSIPFYQIALHGIIPYTSSPMNMSSDYEHDALKLIETGTIPSFKWIYGDNSELKETDYNFYSVNYLSWIDDATKLYNDMNTALSSCQNSTIISHKQIQDGLYQTMYDNHTTIYVNYNDFQIETNGIIIETNGYKVVKGEGK